MTTHHGIENERLQMSAWMHFQGIILGHQTLETGLLKPRCHLNKYGRKCAHIYALDVQLDKG